MENEHQKRLLNNQVNQTLYVAIQAGVIPGQTLALVLVTALTKMRENHFFIFPSAVSPLRHP
jgi:hypothetical protein